MKILRDDASDTGDWISERNPKGRTSCTPKLGDLPQEGLVPSGRSIIRKTSAKQKEKGNLLPKTREERPRDGIKEIQKADLTLKWNLEHKPCDWTPLPVLSIEIRSVKTQKT